MLGRTKYAEFGAVNSLKASLRAILPALAASLHLKVVPVAAMWFQYVP